MKYRPGMVSSITRPPYYHDHCHHNHCYQKLFFTRNGQFYHMPTFSNVVANGQDGLWMTEFKGGVDSIMIIIKSILCTIITKYIILDSLSQSSWYLLIEMSIDYHDQNCKYLPSIFHPSKRQIAPYVPCRSVCWRHHQFSNNNNNNDHSVGTASPKWLSGWTGLLQVIIRMDQPLASDHPDGPASCKWSEFK